MKTRLTRELHIYKNIDTVVDPAEMVYFPTKFLNSLDTYGLSPHSLRLKIRGQIMLLKNLETQRLCNGTRLMVTTLLSHVITATIITGCDKGEDVLIPRIPLTPSGFEIPSPHRRLQFLPRLCFAMWINKP